MDLGCFPAIQNHFAQYPSPGRRSRTDQAVESAKAILLDAVEQHPKCPLLHYRLACYECLLGEIEVAKTRAGHR